MRLVFTLVLFIFVACVYVTLNSFPEIPLDILASASPEVSYPGSSMLTYFSIVVAKGHNSLTALLEKDSSDLTKALQPFKCAFTNS